MPSVPKYFLAMQLPSSRAEYSAGGGLDERECPALINARFGAGTATAWFDLPALCCSDATGGTGGHAEAPGRDAAAGFQLSRQSRCQMQRRGEASSPKPVVGKMYEDLSLADAIGHISTTARQFLVL